MPKSIGLFLVVGQICFSQGGDSCADAEFASDLSCFDFDLNGMTASNSTVPSCTNVQHVDVWFAGTVDITGMVTLNGSFPFAGGGAYVTIYTGNCSSLNEVLCEAITFGNQSVSVNLSEGFNIFIRITRNGGGNNLSGEFCSTGLPVTWSKATRAIIIEKKASIIFSTAQEINNSHFELQHSQDGRQYQPIGKIEGAGNTTSETPYEYIHETPANGYNYYRVKQVDYDGRYSYSNVASVVYRSGEVSVYPNPVTDRLTVSSPNISSMVIYNHLGRKVGDYRLVEGANLVDMAQMESGLYLLKFSDGSVERVVKN